MNKLTTDDLWRSIVLIVPLITTVVIAGVFDGHMFFELNGMQLINKDETLAGVFQTRSEWSI